MRWGLGKAVKSSPKAPTVGALQTLPDERDRYEAPATSAGNVAGFSLQASLSSLFIRTEINFPRLFLSLVYISEQCITVIQHSVSWLLHAHG